MPGDEGGLSRSLTNTQALGEEKMVTDSPNAQNLTDTGTRGFEKLRRGPR